VISCVCLLALLRRRCLLLFDCGCFWIGQFVLFLLLFWLRVLWLCFLLCGFWVGFGWTLGVGCWYYWWWWVVLVCLMLSGCVFGFTSCC